MATQENVDKMLEIIQASLTPEQMFEISKKLAASGREKVIGDSGFTKETLSTKLPQMDKKETNSNTGISEFQNFEKQASELTEMHFRRVWMPARLTNGWKLWRKYSHISNSPKKS